MKHRHKFILCTFTFYDVYKLILIHVLFLVKFQFVYRPQYSHPINTEWFLTQQQEKHFLYTRTLHDWRNKCGEKTNSLSVIIHMTNTPSKNIVPRIPPLKQLARFPIVSNSSIRWKYLRSVFELFNFI